MRSSRAWLLKNHQWISKKKNMYLPCDILRIRSYGGKFGKCVEPTLTANLKLFFKQTTSPMMKPQCQNASFELLLSSSSLLFRQNFLFIVCCKIWKSEIYISISTLKCGAKVFFVTFCVTNISAKLRWKKKLENIVKFSLDMTTKTVRYKQNDDGFDM